MEQEEIARKPKGPKYDLLDAIRLIGAQMTLIPTERLLLVFIVTYDFLGTAFPGVTRLARETGLSVRQVQYLLRSLERRGYLTTEARYVPGRRDRATNLYTVNVVKLEESRLVGTKVSFILDNKTYSGKVMAFDNTTRKFDVKDGDSEVWTVPEGMFRILATQPARDEIRDTSTNVVSIATAKAAAAKAKLG